VMTERARAPKVTPCAQAEPQPASVWPFRAAETTAGRARSDRVGEIGFNMGVIVRGVRWLGEVYGGIGGVSTDGGGDNGDGVP
jgi:hypothetical protein